MLSLDFVFCFRLYAYFQNMVFLIDLIFLAWFLKYFDSSLIFIFAFISFPFKFTLLSCFHSLMGLLDVWISERLERDIIRINQSLIIQFNLLFFKPFVKKKINQRFL